MTPRVFLVDDHPLFLTGLRVALEDAGITVVGEAHTGKEALDSLRAPEFAADVVLVDLQLPDRSGLDVIRSLVSDAEAGAPTPYFLVLSASESDTAVVMALRAGAHGYLVKETPREELIRAVWVVAGGGAAFSPVVAARLAPLFSAVHELPSRAALPELTDRERQVLDLVARGHNNRRIARALTLSEKTVRNHVSHVFTKLGVGDRAAAVVLARDAGLGQ
ncbi:response regulator transcription factor [Streptomyces sp. NPDC026672]|uniref:response regulator transcription factor n=1 Tax=unclassified Streptomyces TaxID=2593676 RepID=UPI0033F00C81